MKKTALITLTVLALSLLCASAKNDKTTLITRNLDIFNSLYKELNAFYVDSLDAEKSIERAITGMLSDIDPYTEYIPAKDREDFQVITTGEYGGIGSYIVQRGDTTYISEPYAGSPAARSGLRSGDAIILIDGDTMIGQPSNKVSERLKGQARSRVKVSVKRPYHKGDSLLTFDIMREKIQVDPVPYYGVVKGNIGYINLSTYNEKAADRVKEALLEFKNNGNVKAIALDLRGNGGGLLDEAVKIVGYFVPKGTEVLQTRGRSIQNKKTYKTPMEPLDTETPLFVLVDGGTASSSEITAGALQDLDRAVIVGSRSFGKGLVQATRGLPYDGTLKVTIAKYYIPSGRLIQAIDYSHRNSDGVASRIPDSLTTVFHTAGGREVRDGGGITPDIKIESKQMTRIYYNILRDNWAFDYSVKYHATHPAVEKAEDFKVTDEIFADFKQFIDPKRFAYDKVCETAMRELRKIAKIEGYLNDSVEAQMDVLSGLLKHDLQHDLDLNRADISELLTTEILTRYFYQQGQILGGLRYDEALDKIEAVISEPGKYESILSVATAKPTAKPAAKKSKKK